MRHVDNRRVSSAAKKNAEFNLDVFLPYRIRVFYKQVAQAVAAACNEDCSITPAQWRVLATIGSKEMVSSAFIASHASMDKVAVSRSVTQLKERKWVTVSTSRADRRLKNLRLTRAGRRIYQQLVPKVIEVERSMLCGLSRSEQAVFWSMLQRIENNLPDT